MLPKNQALRTTIYGNNDEMHRFRQLVVNVVMATDICDKQLKEFRNARVQKAFAFGVDDGDDVKNSRENINRKATIGIEYLIQAADVSHTMQPWHVYTDWNRRLFHELYKVGT